MVSATGWSMCVYALRGQYQSMSHGQCHVVWASDGIACGGVMGYPMAWKPCHGQCRELFHRLLCVPGVVWSSHGNSYGLCNGTRTKLVEPPTVSPVALGPIHGTAYDQTRRSCFIVCRQRMEPSIARPTRRLAYHGSANGMLVIS